MLEELPTPVLLAVLAGAIAVVVVSGSRLAQVGDRLAEHTGLGRLFVGAILVAVATSLPELATDLTAAIGNAPDLAIGDLFGSSLANMAILAIVDLRYRGRILPTVELGHTRVACIAIGLTALAVMAINTPPGIAVFDIGIASIALSGGYVAALAWFRRVPPIGVVTPSPTPFHRPIRLRDRWAGTGPLARRFAAASAYLVVAAPTMTLTTEELSHRWNVSQTVLGVTLLAATTSLPELVTSLSAVRIGAHDLAVGNLLGSNAANIAMISIIDAAYRPGPILGAVNPTHALAGTGAILLMALALASIVSGQSNRAQRLEPDGFIILLAYVGTVIAIALRA